MQSSRSYYLLPRALALADLGLSDEEHITLSLFVCRTAHQWCGWQDQHFWQSLVLQGVLHSNAIAHALISFAALDRSCDKDISGEYRDRLELLACRQTQKAVNFVNANPPSLTVSLISCVVFTCLQNFQDIHQAHRLIQHGAKLLEEYDERVRAGGSGITADERYLIDNSVRPLLERLQARYCTIADPVVALCRSVRQHRSLGLPCSPTPVIGDQFESLLEARDCLLKIFAWGHDSVPEPDSDQNDQNNFLEKLDELLNNWQISSDRSTIAIDSTQPQKDHRSGKLLRAARMAGTILLKTYGTDDETVFDAFLPEFRGILECVRDVGLEDASTGRFSFGIDAGMLDMIGMVVGRCRDPPTRHATLAFVANTQRVEGDRVGMIGHTIMNAVVDVEEHGLYPRCAADIPGARRVRLMEDQQYFGLCKVRVLLLTAPYDVSRGARVIQRWVDIPGLPMVRSIQVARAQKSAKVGVPDMIYGSHRAAFLEDASSKKYYHFPLKRFYFSVPRI